MMVKDDMAIAAGFWEITCRDKYGQLKWVDVIHNLVVNEGLNYLLSVGLAAGTPDTTWFVGLTDGTPTVAAGDTMVSHAGWVEVTAYTGSRQAWTPGSVASQSVDNSASKASFAINADATTVGGAFLFGADTGTTGTLYAAGAFTGGDKILDNLDTLEVTATFTQSSS